MRVGVWEDRVSIWTRAPVESGFRSDSLIVVDYTILLLILELIFGDIEQLLIIFTFPHAFLLKLALNSSPLNLFDS